MFLRVEGHCRDSHIRVTFLYDEVEKGFQLGIAQPSGGSGRTPCHLLQEMVDFIGLHRTEMTIGIEWTRSAVIKTCNSLQSFFYG